jgi:hypothetical protein
VRADVDLPWYWGFAARSWAGEAGLRSPLGAQLEAIRSGLHLEHGAADSWRALEEADKRRAAVRHARTIEGRLSRLTAVQREVLHLHYDPHVTLPFEVDGAACLLKASRSLCGEPLGGVGRVAAEVLRKALHGATPQQRERIATQAAELVATARTVYEELTPDAG